MKPLKKPNDKGSIYITVMIILMVILMLLAMLMTITTRDVRTSNLYSGGIKAYYIAHSGIAKGIAHAMANPEESMDDFMEQNEPFPQYPASHGMEWRVEYDEENDNYTITSESYLDYNDKITLKRKLEVTVRIQDELVEVVSWQQKYDS